MRRLRADRRQWFAFTPRNSDKIVNTQPDPEAIEARSKVGRAGRDADCDFVHDHRGLVFCHVERS